MNHSLDWSSGIAPFTFDSPSSHADVSEGFQETAWCVCWGSSPWQLRNSNLSHHYTEVAKSFTLLFWGFPPSFSSSHPLQVSWRENFLIWGLSIMSLQLHKTARSLLVSPSTRSSFFIRQRVDFQLLLISRKWVNQFPLGQVTAEGQLTASWVFPLKFHYFLSFSLQQLCDAFKQTMFIFYIDFLGSWQNHWSNVSNSILLRSIMSVLEVVFSIYIILSAFTEKFWGYIVCSIARNGRPKCTFFLIISMFSIKAHWLCRMYIFNSNKKYIM